jgi:uncharacterized membrane protein
MEEFMDDSIEKDIRVFLIDESRPIGLEASGEVTGSGNTSSSTQQQISGLQTQLNEQQKNLQNILNLIAGSPETGETKPEMEAKIQQTDLPPTNK